jgi:acylphosphatase
MLRRINITVFGKVQGVLFRASICQKAKEFNLIGWVKNQSDDSVKIIAQGKKDNLEKLIKWCYNGPKNAIIEKVDIEWKKATNEFKNFEIKYE